MRVTLYSDASFKDGKGTWAVYLRSQLGSVSKSGRCPETITDNNEAELYAVLAGIHLARHIWPSTEGFYVRSDSMVVCRLNEGKKSRREGINRLAEAIKAIGLPLSIKHVKGHQGGKETAAYLNRHCDRLARQHHAAAVKTPPVKKVKS